MSVIPLDQSVRDAALNPEQSFIVQAPAGSGKTELLIQRFLALLATVDAPEEIVAITFTKKAAFEMRERIIKALRSVQGGKPELAHEQKTWHLACNVFKRDQAQGWNLLKNPNRLRLQTIDSLSYHIVKQAPMLSDLGSISEAIKDPDVHYRQAVRNVLMSLEEQQDHTQALKQLLLYLDNNYTKIENLLVSMLAKRDQWLRHIFGDNDRNYLEASLKKINIDLIEICKSEFPTQHITEIQDLIAFSFYHLKEKSPSNEREKWQAIANLLLTRQFEWRKMVDKRNGFPSKGSKEEKIYFDEMKDRHKQLVENIKSNDLLRQALENILTAPDVNYTNQTWEILFSLITVLRVLAGELKLVLHENNRVDFIEVAQSASQALGLDGNPSELALKLDYKIKHLLIDEFQDTSITQFEFIQKLTMGWQAKDNRTLFLVGDPMQSIYRFRQAEVGLFLLAKQKGIGNVPLIFLQLSVNFRSTSNVVNWINDCFSSLFPIQENKNLGAITYAPSVSFHKMPQEKSVFCHAVENEGEQIAVIIKQKWASDPNHKIGILVRSRTHLKEILPVLKAKKIHFHAVEIESLNENIIINDLFALTRALLSPIDKTAWLSILRAPWCGLTLSDLHVLTNDSSHNDLWYVLQDPPNTLSDDGEKRLNSLVSKLIPAVQARYRKTLRESIEEVWLSLKAPLCYEDEEVMSYAQDYFQLLDELEKEEGMINPHHLKKHLNKLYSTASSSADDRLQVMTIHKSKGLEFDSVIIAGLGFKSKQDDLPILRWLEGMDESGEANLVLAPIKSEGEKEEDAICAYLKKQDQKKQSYELTRLLYVAATRAKTSLHLITNSQKEKASTGSFLSLLSPYFEDGFDIDNKIKTEVREKSRYFKRLNSDYFDEEKSDFPSDSDAQTTNIPAFNLHDLINEQIGTVVHQILEQLAKHGLESPFAYDESLWKKYLSNVEVQKKDIIYALEKVGQAIKNTLSDERGKWILSNQHKDHASEYALSVIPTKAGIQSEIEDFSHNKAIKHLIIDRTFSDQHSKRWIIDYKTSMPKKGQSLEDFLDEMKSKHQDQLETYAHAISLKEKSPIQLGLYFPMLPAWCEWSYE